MACQYNYMSYETNHAESIKFGLANGFALRATFLCFNQYPLHLQRIIQ